MHALLRRSVGRASGCLLAAALMVVAPGLSAQGIPFVADANVAYDLDDERLGVFLERFFAHQGIPVVLSDQVRRDSRTLAGRRSGSPADILRSVLESNALASYYDGYTVHIYDLGEVVTQYFAVAPERLSEFRSSVRNFASESRYNRYQITGSGLVTVTGVPPYVDRIGQLAGAVGNLQAPDRTVFQMFVLNYAWAADRSFTVAGRAVTLPGVASLLRELLYTGNGFAPPLELQLPAAQPSLRGQGLASRGANGHDDSLRVLLPDGSDVTSNSRGRDALERIQAQQAARAPTPGAGNTRIVADPYRNAVIVRDVPERIPMYADLIETLDVPTEVVEIEATIIDIDTDHLHRLGVEWRLGDDEAEAVFAEEGTKRNFLDAIGADDVALLDQIPGFQLGAIIGNRGQFIARINALEQEGAMHITSRSQVVTLNDVEAVLESTRELFFPVEGAFEVDLFNVLAGTVLRVTPHVVEEEEQRRIQLFIAIQDGDVSLSGSSDDSGRRLPVVTRTAVNTQAVIDVGRSLLLGGLVRDTTTTTTRKVPVLGSIPLLGRLFRSESETTGRTERMFLLSPRLVRPDGSLVEGTPQSESVVRSRADYWMENAPAQAADGPPLDLMQDPSLSTPPTGATP